MGLLNRSKIGLDIGGSAVRIAEISGIDSSGYAIVRRAAVVQLPPEAVSGGDVRRPTVVAAAVDEAFKTSGIAKSGVVLGFGGRQCAVARLESPAAATAAERTMLIRNSGEDVAPTVPTEESALSWNLVGSLEGARRPTNILNVAAAARASLQTYLDVCRLAEVELRAVDLTAAALLRSVVRIRPLGDTDISTVVDIGATATIVATREGPHLRSVRTVPIGGEDITKALASGLGIELELAEEQKRHMRVAERARTIDTDDVYVDDSDENLKPKTTAEDILARTVDRLVEEVARSVSYDAKANDRRLTQGIQLVGGGSRLPGLTERFAVTLGVPTTRATAWADVDFSRRTAKLLATRDVADLVDELTCAVGLAMWKVPE